MSPSRLSTVRAAGAIACALLACLVWPTTANAQTCGSACCTAAGGSFQTVGFESFSAGTSVEGLGAIHPDLNITGVAWPYMPASSCAAGSAKVIVTGSSSPYSAYSTSSSVINGCLVGTHGFADSSDCVLDYDFTFKPGMTVSCFSLRLLDYGDYFPFGGLTHQVFLTAYDADGNVVNQAVLTVKGGVSATGDACATEGDPGD